MSMPTPAPLALDAVTVAAVLYVSPFTPADWTRLGTAHLAGYVAAVLAVPQFRLPELVGLIQSADQAGWLPFADVWAAARTLAPSVIAVLSN